MKLIIYLMFAFLSSFCFSCTEELETIPKEEPVIKLIHNGTVTKSIINESPLKEIPDTDAFEVCNLTMVPLNDNIVPFSITGCQTFYEADSYPQSIGVSKEVAASLGIDPTRTYKSIRYEAKIRAGINNGLEFVQLASPLCGYKIHSKPLQRGYTWNVVENTTSIIMTTSIFKCISDSQGQNYNDLWIPCKKEDIIWNFGVK